ncbi:MAG: outer membrane beta-barrel protein [Gammaproteobacteria bacterium]|jgi:hypothetical protein|nr:outer membrane beta-barrel protein [Gammaproteobacteria bacterium]
MLAAATLVDVAVAEERGWYVGAAVGMSEVDVSESLWRDASVTEASLDAGDFGYQAWGGYRLHPHFAIEGGLIDLGEAIFSGRSSGDGSIWELGPIEGRARVRGMTVQAAAFWPARGRLQAYAKGGILLWSTSASYSATINDINRFNDNGGTPTGGLGVQWRAWRGWWLRGEWQYLNVTFAGRQSVNASLASIGVLHYLP